jgi:uncharacterized protein
VLTRHEVDWNVLTTVHAANGNHGRLVCSFLRDDVVGTVYVQMFDTALANYHGESVGMSVHARTCGQHLALEHNGDMYSCDHYVEPGYRLGNIAEKHMMDLIVLRRRER